MSKSSSRTLVSTSKFLSLILRHKPETIGLKLDPEGWADIDEIIARSDRPLTRALILEVVESNDKQRFRLSPDQSLIRASQGHSVSVDLGLEAVAPPERLYHGTAERFVDSIRQEGLLPRNRQYVHLSADRETAIRVGERHGKPAVLMIHALRMHQDGIRFFCSDNGVWLTDRVPPASIAFDGVDQPTG